MTIQPNSQFIIYRTEDGQTRLEVRLHGGDVWLSQKLMAELFQKDVRTISEHIKNILEEGELSRDSTIRKYQIVQLEGVRKVARNIEFYNLDMIISVGYRVRSHTATRFRQWATARLKEYLIKGFILDDERLKNPDQPFDYFDELLQRIQDIRASEKRFYQKITDIFASSVDYEPAQEVSIRFFRTVQNKLHWAISGSTAAEIIYKGADSTKRNMGLTTWRHHRLRKQDAVIATNYLDEEESSALNNLVEQYLVFAEGQALRRIPMYMQDWIKKLDGFLTLNDRDILEHAGKVSHEMALQHAGDEYKKFYERCLRLETAQADEKDFDALARRIADQNNEQKK